MEQVNEQKLGNPLGYAPVGKLLKQFALPAVISMLVNALYNIVDQILLVRALATWAMPPRLWLSRSLRLFGGVNPAGCRWQFLRGY